MKELIVRKHKKPNTQNDFPLQNGKQNAIQLNFIKRLVVPDVRKKENVCRVAVTRPRMQSPLCI